jgi:hypothetical protein
MFINTSSTAAVAQDQKIIYRTLDIFEEILERPFNGDNFGIFISLLTALCGSKHYSSAVEVLNLL